MKKMIMVLIMAFTMMTGLFADVKLVPKDTFNDYIVPIYKDEPSIQPQIAYVADTWEDAYEKTGVSKYGWLNLSSYYCDCTRHYCLLVKVRINGNLRWVCYEFPGDGTETMYVADAY